MEIKVGATVILKVKSMTWSSTASVPGHIPSGVGVVVVLALFAVLPARADVRIVSSPGGAVDAHLAAFARVRQSGERVIIDGPCLSACTLVLSTIPRNRICVTRRAVLGFHAPRWFDPVPAPTRPGGYSCRCRLLSPRGACLDKKAGWANAEAHLSSR